MTYDEREQKISSLTEAVEKLEKAILCVQDGEGQIRSTAKVYALYDLKDEKLNTLIPEHLADARDDVERRINLLCKIRDRADDILDSAGAV